MKETNKVPIFVVANKIDLVTYREISTEEGLQIAQSLGCPFAETSALWDFGTIETSSIRALSIHSIIARLLKLAHHPQAVQERAQPEPTFWSKLFFKRK